MSLDQTFARRSSGLVRAASTFDASLVNLYVATFPIMVSFLLGIVLPWYPGANLYLTLLIGFALALPILLSYAVASSVMRRSGGDYVFISRLIHPALGFAANFVFVLFQVVFLTSAGYYFCRWCLAPLARIVGVETGSTGLLDLANTLTEPDAVFVVSEVFVLGFGALFVLRTTRSVLKIFRYTLPLSALGLLAFAVALLIHSKSGLQANFDAYVAGARGADDAAAVAARSAADAGFSASPTFSWSATVLAITWPAFSLPYYLGSAYFAGEVRSGKRAQLLAGPLTAVVAVVGSLVLVALSLGRLGPDFLGATQAADYPVTMGIPGPPTYMEVVAGSSGNVVLGVLILIGFGSWLIPTVPMSLLIMTRCMLGWSMDRVAPDALSRVSTRTNSPYVAVLVVTAISAVVSWFWAYTTFFTVVVGAFAQVITLGLGCLAASLLPYRYPDQYETAPLRGRFARVPWLTWIGGLGAVAALLIVWNFARDPFSGVNVDASPEMFWFSLAMFPLGVVLYYVAVGVRRAQGHDLSLAFREIPPD
ncbi:APC family permease [Spongisporangium articulatum]|uniref:APC family permease n=1 Tax=Spongisporangium articulatum TaxID=3362603 RepID=A0ABW8AQW6_9ACTN